MSLPVSRSVREHVPVAHGGVLSSKTKNSDIVDFSSNISPLGAPTSVKTALKKISEKY